MTSREIKIEVCVRRETRRLAVLSPDGERSVWVCHQEVEVLRATVVRDDEPTGVVCGRVVTPPALRGAKSVPAKVDSPRPEGAAS